MEGRDFIYIFKNRKNWGRQRRRWMLSWQKKAIPGRREELPSAEIWLVRVPQDRGYG